MNIIENQSLLEFNTFRIDANAKYFTRFKSEKELLKIINTEIFQENEFLIIGGGSNILFTKDFDGIVLKNEIEGIEVISKNRSYVEVEVGSGVEWDDFVKYCVDKRYYGVENLVLIPGKVGTAPIQNIGAYGVEVKDTIVAVRGIMAHSGEVYEYANEECFFDYRDSVFKNTLKGKLIITSVVFRLSKEKNLNIEYGSIKNEFEKLNISNPDIEDVFNTIKQVRMEKLPSVDEIGSAGSFFKNPVINRDKLSELKNEFSDIVYYEIDENCVKLPAAWLIDKCGFKGKRIGNTGTYKNQALVIVNHGNAAGEEIKLFSEEIQKAVSEKFGVEITPEVNIF